MTSIAHSGQYKRKVIVDKYPPAFADKVTEFKDPNGIKYELEMTLPDDLETFLEFYDSTYYKHIGASFSYRKSPWLFADGREKRRKRLANRG